MAAKSSLEKTCELCQDPVACLTGKVPCDLCGAFLVQPSLETANSMLDWLSGERGKALDKATRLSARVDGLLEANSTLVFGNHDLAAKLRRAEADVVTLARELASARREVAIMQRIAEGKRFSLLDNDRYTGPIDQVQTGLWTRSCKSGGFDVVSEHPPRNLGRRGSMSALETSKPRKAGFDVGNGFFTAGDRCIVHGNHATILDITQDGDAEIRYDDRECRTIKWKDILPTNTDDPHPHPSSVGGTRRCFP